MATATVHIAEVGGYAGRARCFAIDPPFEGNQYVTVCVTPAFGTAVRPEAMVFPATETGACAVSSLVRQPGTHVLHTQADTDQQFADACAAALLILGQPGYTIEAQ